MLTIGKRQRIAGSKPVDYRSPIGSLTDLSGELLAIEKNGGVGYAEWSMSQTRTPNATDLVHLEGLPPDATPG
jgi:hypothetical protein